MAGQEQLALEIARAAGPEMGRRFLEDVLALRPDWPAVLDELARIGEDILNRSQCHTIIDRGDSCVVGRREGPMRRWLYCGATWLACELAANSAFAQFNLATLPTSTDSAATLPSQSGRHIFLAPRAGDAQAQPADQQPGDPAAAPDANGDADANGRPNRDRGDGHGHQGHHRNNQGGGVWLLWPGYSWGCNGYGYPILGPVTPGFPYYPQPGFGMALPAAAPACTAPRIAKPADDPKPKFRVTNADQKAKAGRFIAFGDTNFGKQSYLSASERYKTAAQMAPDLAEAYLRQGFALVAMGQYESAAKAFRRGLQRSRRLVGFGPAARSTLRR